MSGRLEGRKILITGAASGIGKATALLFANEGAALALLDINAEALATVGAATGGTAIPVDLADADAVIAAVATAAAALGGIDGLVNCAAIADPTPLAELDKAVWDRFLAINMTAPYLICRAALPHLLTADQATIVNIASGQALLPNAPFVSAYAATKAGLTTFTKALGAEFAPKIRANVVAPGIVDTPLVQSMLGGYDNPDDAPFVQQYAMKRVAQPKELAEAILFLSSEASSYVTGTVLAVDGGRTFH